MSGRKLFGSRETLASTDVQDFLMDQAVPRFPSALARQGDWPAPPDGALSYLEDVRRHDERRGGAWVPLLGGGRGTIASAALSGATGANNALFQLSQTNAAEVRAGEHLEHRVNLALYGAATVQTVTLWVARYAADGSGGRVQVEGVSLPVGGNTPDDGGSRSILLEEDPPAGNWFWRVEGGSTATGGTIAYVAYGHARHVVAVTRRS